MNDDTPTRGPLLWVCRDIPGTHTGGPGCFCKPYDVDPFDQAAVSRMLDLADHPERQANDEPGD